VAKRSAPTKTKSKSRSSAAASKKSTRKTSSKSSHKHPSKKVSSKSTAASKKARPHPSTHRKAKPTPSSTHVKKPTPTQPSTLSRSSQEPTTMEELLREAGAEIKGLKRGQIVKGVITSIGPKSMYVDLGAKTEGIISDKEFTAAEEYIRTLHEGDELDVYVLNPENDQGQILLALRSAAQNFFWNQFVEWMESGKVIEVTGKEVNKGGLIVSVTNTMDGFVPGSQFGKHLIGKLDQLIGEKIEVKVIEVNRDQTRLILSEKEVSEAEDLKKKRQLLNQLQVGDVKKGTVTRVTNYGIFVRLDDSPLEGLVHISELAWERIDTPGEIFKPGDPTKVKVISVDPQSGQLSFSIKQLTSDPWDHVQTKYPVESKVKGQVSRIMPFGVLVSLEPGVDGLIHVSKLTADQQFQVGQTVKCYVETVEPENRRIGLALVLTAKPVGYK
jgi:ribosomal protein S1